MMELLQNSYNLYKLSAISPPFSKSKLDCNIYYGPYVYNFQEVYDFLETNNMAEQIYNEYDLSNSIMKKFKNPKKIDYENIDLLNNYGDKILQHTIVELNKLIQIKNENT